MEENEIYSTCFGCGKRRGFFLQTCQERRRLQKLSHGLEGIDAALLVEETGGEDGQHVARVWIELERRLQAVNRVQFLVILGMTQAQHPPTLTDERVLFLFFSPSSSDGILYATHTHTYESFVRKNNAKSP